MVMQACRFPSLMYGSCIATQMFFVGTDSRFFVSAHANWKNVSDSLFLFGTDDVVYVMACQPRARDMVGVILPIEYR
jgi:hypothetical protein